MQDRRRLDAYESKHETFVITIAHRSFDLVMAIGGALLFSPLIVLAAGVTWISMGRPIIFSQVRAGLNGRPFRIYKFRTMKDARAPDGSQMPDDQRLTPAGRWLRSTSLDELPEIWNVIKGDMSIVGPRPLLMDYLPLYSPEQARRHEVKPGITGWAQVNGRNAISWDERFALDVWYVDHRSVWLDLRIIGMTFARVWRREGVSGHGHVTMDRFRGPGRRDA